MAPCGGESTKPPPNVPAHLGDVDGKGWDILQPRIAQATPGHITEHVGEGIHVWIIAMHDAEKGLCFGPGTEGPDNTRRPRPSASGSPVFTPAPASKAATNGVQVTTSLS